MGNLQSVEQSPEEHEATQREAEARDAAFNARMDRMRDDAMKRQLHETVHPKIGQTHKTGTGQLAAATNSAGLEHDRTAQTSGIHPETLSNDLHRTIDSSRSSSISKVKRAAEVESASDEGSDHERLPRKRKRHAVKEPPPALFKATVKVLPERDIIKVAGPKVVLDTEVIVKIRKCLDRANHPNTLEGEANAAIELANRWMKQHNLKKSEVLAYEPPEVQMQYGGGSIVSVTRTDGDDSKPVRHFAFMDNLSLSMKTFFDCKTCSRSKASSVDFIFYGIAENTIAAAFAFEMAFNLISEWSRKYKGIGRKNSYSLGASRELYRMARASKATEEEEAKKTERDALAAREEQEAAERQAQVDRLAPLPQSPATIASDPDEHLPNSLTGDHSFPGQGVADNPVFLDSDEENAGEDNTGHDNEVSDDESDEDCDPAEFTAEDEAGSYDLSEVDGSIKKRVKPEADPANTSQASWPSQHLPSSLMNTSSAPLQGLESNSGAEAQERASNQLDSELEPTSTWASHMQLVTFRETATKIADDVAKGLGMKMAKSRSKRSHKVRDQNAYHQGVEDGKKIDVRKRTIKE